MNCNFTVSLYLIKLSTRHIIRFNSFADRNLCGCLYQHFVCNYFTDGITDEKCL